MGAGGGLYAGERIRHMAADDLGLSGSGEYSLYILGEEGQRAQGQADGGADVPVLADHQLGGAAADVGEQAGIGGLRGAPEGAQVGQSGLLRAGDDLDLRTGGAPDGGESFVGIDDVAQRGCGKNVELLHAQVPQQVLELGDDLAGLLDPRGGEDAVFHIAGQSNGLFFPKQELEATVFIPVDGKTHGIGAYIHHAAVGHIHFLLGKAFGQGYFMHRSGKKQRYSAKNEKTLQRIPA